MPTYLNLLHQTGEAHGKTADQVREELDYQRVLLENNTNTNGNVVTMYNNRKASVSHVLVHPMCVAQLEIDREARYVY